MKGRRTSAWLMPVCVAAAVGVGSAAPPAAPLNVADALERYSRGQFDVASSVVAKLYKDHNPPTEITRPLEHDGPLWIDALGPMAAPKRRLIAATFALDMAHAANGWASWAFAQRLMAWGCARLRDDPHPQAAERSWYLASVGIAEERGTAIVFGPEGFVGDGTNLLLGASWPRPPRPIKAAALPPPDYVHAQAASDAMDESAGELAEGHLAHVIARVSDAPEIQLAKVRAIIAGSWAVGKAGVPLEQQSRAFPGDITEDYLAKLAANLQAPVASPPASTGLNLATRPSGSVDVVNQADFMSPFSQRPVTDEALRIKYLRDALAILERLSAPGPMLADVHLYYGVIALRFAERAVALQHFSEVERLTTDPVRLYLARVLEGIAHERSMEWEPAAASYRSALNAVPRARTAATLLTAVLLRHGHNADAETLVDGFLSAPGVPDPWNRLLMADPVVVAGYVDQLRKAIQ